MIDTFSLEIEIVKVAGSLRKGTFLEKSLSIVTLGAVDILGLEFIFFFLLSPEEDKAKTLGEAFLEIEEAETLLKECLVI